MDKVSIPFFFILTLISCSSQSSKEMNEILNDHLDKQIEQAHTSLTQRVNALGISPVGRDFLNRADGMVEKLASLKHITEVDKVLDISDEIYDLARNTKDSVVISDFFIKQSAYALDQSNLNQYMCHLKTFVIETMEVYENKLIYHSYLFDIAQPIVIPVSDTIKRGQDFQAEIAIEALLVGINHDFLVQYEGKDNFVPLKLKSRNKRGVITIKKPKVGNHNLKFKLVYPNHPHRPESVVDYTFTVSE